MYLRDLRCAEELAERRGLFGRHLRLVQDYRRGGTNSPPDSYDKDKTGMWLTNFIHVINCLSSGSHSV